MSSAGFVTRTGEVIGRPQGDGAVPGGEKEAVGVPNLGHLARLSEVAGTRPQVSIREVGPRDGLQAEAPIPVEARVQMIGALITAGIVNVEICSFVSPKAVPSMAGAAEVVALLGEIPGVRRTALVPNVRGAQMAVEAGVDELTVTLSASASYNWRNVKMTVEDSIESVRGIVEVAMAAGMAVDCVVSCAFGSPYEGEIEPAEVARICEAVLGVGAERVTLADTTGMATPRRIHDVLDVLSTKARDGVGLHLHETRGTGLVNAYAGILAGVQRFDSSIGGLGGSPFAAGAAGNVATEDLVYLCDDLGIVTGASLAGLLEASALTAGLVGRAMPSRVAAAGPRLPHADGAVKRPEQPSASTDRLLKPAVTPEGPKEEEKEEPKPTHRDGLTRIAAEARKVTPKVRDGQRGDAPLKPPPGFGDGSDEDWSGGWLK
jgi:hydroxymethylglutaryl-CoA lyase